MPYQYKNLRYQKISVLRLHQVNLLFWILIAVLGVIYLWQINFMVAGGYRTRGLEDQIEDIKKNTKQLELGALELQSMEAINKRSQELGLVPMGRTKYVSAQAPVVAFK